MWWLGNGLMRVLGLLTSRPGLKDHDTHNHVFSHYSSFLVYITLNVNKVYKFKEIYLKCLA